MTLQYTFERLHLGVHLLATHPGPIKVRLAEAFDRSLCGVVSSLLPFEARVIWDPVWATATRRPAGNGQGVFQRSMTRLTNAQAVHLAGQILEVERLVGAALLRDASPDVLVL